MNNSQECLEEAERCERNAASASFPELKHEFLMFADAWRKLAVEAEMFSSLETFVPADETAEIVTWAEFSRRRDAAQAVRRVAQSLAPLPDRK